MVLSILFSAMQTRIGIFNTSSILRQKYAVGDVLLPIMPLGGRDVERFLDYVRQNPKFRTIVDSHRQARGTKHIHAARIINAFTHA